MPEPVDDYTTEDGVFDLDRWQDEAQREPYPFTWAGRERILPHVQDLSVDVLSLIGQVDAGDPDAVVGVLRVAFGEDQWADLHAARPMPIGAATKLFNQWMAHCGVDPGEAQSSAVSSNGTAGRSRRTSAGSTASGSPRRSTAPRKAVARRVNSSR